MLIVTEEEARKIINKKGIRKQLILDEGDQIGEEIGRGGFSTVFSIVDKYGNDKNVVLKFGYYGGKSYEINAVKEVQKELEIGGHDVDDNDLHIVKPVAFAEAKDEKYYIIQMSRESVVSKSDPFIRTFFSRKDEKKNDIAALRLALDITTALQFFHQRGYVHRDTKTGNIFYRPGINGEITFLLGDFNTCRKKEEPGTATMVCSKPYCPIIWEGEINPCRDIYGLGATLYELLSDNKDVIRYLQYIASGKGKFIPPTHGTSELHKIIERAMTLDEELNYPNIESLRKELLSLYQKRKKEGEEALEKAEENLKEEKKKLEEEKKKWEEEKRRPDGDKKKERFKVGVIVAAAILLTALFFIIPDSQAVQLCIGNYYYEQADYEKAVERYQELAIQGNADAQNKLGDCYYYGNGVEQDPEQAVAWYRKSAEQGNATAQNNLGYCYDEGIGVEQDPEQAVAWYRKSAEQGNDSGQWNLGMCYYYGNGVRQDQEYGLELIQKAADQGVEKAIAFLNEHS